MHRYNRQMAQFLVPMINARFGGTQFLEEDVRLNVTGLSLQLGEQHVINKLAVCTGEVRHLLAISCVSVDPCLSPIASCIPQLLHVAVLGFSI